MKKLFLLLAVAVLALTACNNKLTVEDVEAAVVQGEKDRIPLLVQQITIIDDITVDSIRITVDIEPMQGYLYTTWKKGKKKTPIIVPVTNIRSSEEHKGYIEWESDWESAGRAYIMGKLKF